MNRKLILYAAVLLPIVFLSAQHPGVFSRYQLHCQRAIQINELAGHIKSPDDAYRLVDMVSAEFSDELPPRWATRSLRNRIARAEYQSAYDPAVLIPEQRVADAWNDYLKKIGAHAESFVTPAELHALRDSEYVDAQFFWARGSQSIWTIPSIYAVGPDGKVAGGCRALEAIRTLRDLDNEPDNLRAARQMIKKGVLLSDIIKNPAKPPAPSRERTGLVLAVLQGSRNPVKDAERQYLRDHGTAALYLAIDGLLDSLLQQ